MIALEPVIVVGVLGGVAARQLLAIGREPEALSVVALALAFVAPWPYGLVLTALGLALAAHRYLRRSALERERHSIAKYLASVRDDVPERSPLPTASDPVAQRALAKLASLDAARAAVAPRARRSTGRHTGVRARFMAAMGHELRSPLNSILGFAQLLEDGSDGPLNEAQRENVVLVRRAAGELLTLLTDILDTARIEAGRVRLERQWVAPVEVLTLALERLRAQFESEVPNVEAQVQPGLAPLYVDRARLGQALLNVARAVPRDRKLQARVREAREGDRAVVRFELYDREKAITEADAARAFDPDPAARPEGRSLALGLALSVSRDLAQLHGGGARAEPLDGGTNWVVWVPAESDDAPPPPKRAPRTPARGGPSYRQR